jgi:hypothetical protein
MKIEFDNYRQRDVLREALMNYLSARMLGFDHFPLYSEDQWEVIARAYVNHRYASHTDEFKRVKVLEKIEDFKEVRSIMEAL